MFKRAYVEITNICNLSCSFCPGTGREKKFINPNEFHIIAEKLRPFTEYIYLHVMGEPLLHPELSRILEIAEKFGFKINITTNGTLLSECTDILFSCESLRKVSISLHSFEGNDGNNLRPYIDSVWQFCENAPFIVSLRLWNEGGRDERNDEIYSILSEKAGKEISTFPKTMNGYKLGEKLYIESAGKFDWPDINSKECNVSFCHGLSQQIAVLCDGTVVPCCLDSEGTVNLGNLLTQSMEEILSSDRVLKIQEGFRNRCPSEELCKHCGYATRF